MERQEFQDGTVASQIAPRDDRVQASGACTARPIRRALIATGIVTPYTHRIYDGIATRHGIDLHVLACSPTEPNRLWELPEARTYRRSVMRGLRWHPSQGGNIYFNPGIVTEILGLRPDVLVVGDFSPTMLLAAATARVLGIPVSITSDTVPDFDPGSSSRIHRMARQAMGRLVNSAIGGSRATLEVYARYGIAPGRATQRPVVAGWDYDGPIPARDERPYDLLFCGKIDERGKGVIHFLEVIRTLVARGRPVKVRVVGEGPLRKHLAGELSAMNIDARFDGYLQQGNLAEAYLSAKLLLFPSRGDAWGIVANEAAQCGTPILISPHAQAAFGLVERFGAGAVLALDAEAWTDAVERHLDNENLWRRASEGGRIARLHLTVEAAVNGFVRGMNMARGDSGNSPVSVSSHG